MAAIREVCCYISGPSQYGGYLVNFTGRGSEDRTPDELYEAASSVRKAKKAARDLAIAYGYEPAFRWSEGDRILEGKWPDEDDWNIA